MWQEIITYIIIAIAVFLASRKLYFKWKKPDDCNGCSTDSCAACGLADLKKDMETNGYKKGKKVSTGHDEAKN